MIEKELPQQEFTATLEEEQITKNSRDRNHQVLEEYKVLNPEPEEPRSEIPNPDAPIAPSPASTPSTPHDRAGDLALPSPEDENEPPPAPLDGIPLPNVWIYEGEAYDLTEFIAKHPGGKFFIGRTKNRDITPIVNFVHRNPERVKKVIEKYALGRKATQEDFHPTNWAPGFIFGKGFNSWKDTPQYDSRKGGQLLDRIRTRINKPEMRKKEAQMDFLFNVVSVILVVAYVLVEWLRLSLTPYMPLYIFAPLMAMLRISLAGVGHYLIHRPQIGFNKIFANVFDINYVPLAMIVTDGHSLMHHPFTQSKVDIKKNVFTFMLELPRYYRVPVHTLHKIAHVLTGMFVRIIEILVLSIRDGIKDLKAGVKDDNLWPLGFPPEYFFGSFGIHFILLGELILFAINGDIVAWLGQFFVTLWIGTFMIVASHDFEEEKTQEKENWAEKDWAVHQIENSYDLTMIGNKYIDCFLSAGLSPHRVHHVLPQQKSGFANIISEDIVREEAEKFNVEWLPPKNFFFDRLPILANLYLGSPSRIAKEKNLGIIQEHFHPEALKITMGYIIKGFSGIGSI